MTSQTQKSQDELTVVPNEFLDVDSDNPLSDFALEIDPQKIQLTDRVQELQSQLSLNIKRSSDIEYEITCCRTKGDLLKLTPDRSQIHKDTFNTLKQLVFAIYRKSLEEKPPLNPDIPHDLPTVVKTLKESIGSKKKALLYLDHILQSYNFKNEKNIEFYNKLFLIFQSEVFSKHGEALKENNSLAAELLELNEKLKLQQSRYTIAFDNPETNKDSFNALQEHIQHLESEKLTLENRLKQEKQHHDELLEENEKQIREAYERETILKQELNKIRKELTDPVESDTKDITLIKTQLVQSQEQVDNLTTLLTKTKKALQTETESNQALQTENLKITDSCAQKN